MPAMTNLCLYSTNVWVKHHICREYRHDVHYVWCSEQFDPSQQGRHTGGSLIPATSSPAEIHRDLSVAVKRPDQHNAKIKEQRNGLKKLARQWLKASEITQPEHDDIIFDLDNRGLEIWRPLIYVIPRAGLAAGRIQPVPASKRAGMGKEFIIADLKGDEFDVIEMDHA